jgi:hypothetical protein
LLKEIKDDPVNGPVKKIDHIKRKRSTNIRPGEKIRHPIAIRAGMVSRLKVWIKNPRSKIAMPSRWIIKGPAIMIWWVVLYISLWFYLMPQD